MSKYDKLFERICSCPSDIRFDELKKALEKMGYSMSSPHSGSSHFTFRKNGCMPITIPKHEPVKKAYVMLVRNVIESEENGNDENS